MDRKIACITGGSRGLGREMALSLARQNIDIVFTYRNNATGAEEVARDIRANGVAASCLELDLEKSGAWNEFSERLQHVLQEEMQGRGIDFLINNAGMGATIPYSEVSEASFDSFMNVHFKGVFFLTQTLLPLLRNGGRIINVSTGTTRFCVPGYSTYASMKGAIEVLTKYLAKELGSRGITVNTVAPGPVETDFNNAAIRSNPEYKSVLSSLSPLGRVGNPDDIGGVIVFLCSDAARWINGQRIEVSGGINL